jgi:hypothetical protein
MAKKLWLASCLILVVGWSPSVSVAEYPLVVLVDDALQATVHSLVPRQMQVVCDLHHLDNSSVADAAQLTTALLGSRLTILKKDALHPMLVERMQHQGVSFLIVEFSDRRESLPAIQDRLRTIHHVLVQIFPEHEAELSQALQAELWKLRSQRATPRPYLAHFASSVAIPAKRFLNQDSAMPVGATQQDAAERLTIEASP